MAVLFLLKNIITDDTYRITVVFKWCLSASKWRLNGV